MPLIAPCALSPSCWGLSFGAASPAAGAALAANTIANAEVSGALFRRCKGETARPRGRGGFLILTAARTGETTGQPLQRNF